MIRLNIPFSEKDRAKETARENGTSLRWDPEGKFWYFPGDTLPNCLQEFVPEQSESQEPTTKVLAVEYTYLPFAREAGAKWDAKYKVCTFTGKKLPIELTGFEPAPFSWEEWVQEEINGKHVSRPPKNPYKLRPHQDTAVAEILKALQTGSPGFLLADDVGIGKTLSAWAAILEATKKETRDILIVCPLGAIPAWRETILCMGDGGNRIIIINYDRLKKVYELGEGKKVKSLKGLARKGTAREFQVIVFDESQKTKNPTSARTKLAVGLYAKSEFLLWLSATAGQNPLELSYLAPLLAHQTGDKAKEISKDFPAWCISQGLQVTRGAYGRLEMEESSQDNAFIHKLIFERRKGVLAGLRRLPSDIAGWPEMQRIPKAFELDVKGKQLYQLAWEEFLQAIKEEIKKTPKNKVLQTATGLGGVIRLRQKASVLKVPHTFELAQELLDSGKQVAISTQFIDPSLELEALFTKAKIPCRLFTGQQNPREKEQNRLAYQKGEAKVIIFTVEEAINLHSGEHNNVPRVQINHDPRWSAISAHQIDGRSHRNGTFAPIYWTFLLGTVEERVITRLLSRMESMREIHGDETESLSILQEELQKKLS